MKAKQLLNYCLKHLYTLKLTLPTTHAERSRSIPSTTFAFCLIITFNLQLATFNSFAQGGVGINTNGALPDNSAMLDIGSDDKGLLIPRVPLDSLEDNLTIPSPTTSLLVYNNGTGLLTPEGYYYWNGMQWVPFLTDNPSFNGGWSLTGNTGTIAGTNFIGTTDTQDWVVKTDNAERLRIRANGNVGIGDAGPDAMLEISETGTTPLMISDGITGNGDLFKIEANGNVGVGTTTPSALLDVQRPLTSTAGAGTAAIKAYNSDYSQVVVPTDIRAGIATVGHWDGSNPGVFHGTGLFANVPNGGHLIHTSAAIFERNEISPIRQNRVYMMGYGIGYPCSETPYIVAIDETSNEVDFVVQGGGNVGVGLCNPSVKLHISHPTTTAWSAFHAGGSGAQFGAETDAATILSTNHVRFYTGGAGFVPDGSAATANGATQKMILTVGGNLGVGISNPVSKVEIAGVDNNAIFRFHYPNAPTATLNSTNYQHNDLLFGSYNVAGASQHYISFGYAGGVKRTFQIGSANGAPWNGTTSFVPTFVVESDGNVGIGTTNPLYKLEVNGTSLASTSMRVSKVVNHRGELFFTTGTGNDVNSDDIASIRGEITQTTPTLKGALGFRVNVGDNTDYAMYINSDRNVGINTEIPGYALQVGNAGDGTEARANVWANLSDKRLKENFEEISNPIEMVKELKGLYFDWKSTGKKDLGFIAQDVQQILPEIVSESPTDGYFSMQYGNITALLVEAIKEQQQFIENLEKDNIELKTQNSELKTEKDAEVKELQHEIIEIKKILTQQAKK